ncbi:hypothetical protein [Caenispirillum bisanense]|uniref:hypothetical protein n=1 Tax=Caenispirillum bisanense TaxID=414052 RepID=UPI0031DA039F
MSVPDILLSYPAILTNKDWQKKKGPFAKLAGKTGVGESLNACEKAWQAVKWGVFDTSKLKNKARSDIEGAWKVAQGEYKRSIEPLRKALQGVMATTDKTAAAFKKNKLIPSSATKAAQDISKAAERLLVATRSIDTRFFEEKMERYKKFDKLNSYRDALKDRELAREFQAFCEKEFSTENLEFLVRSKGVKVTEKNATAVYDTYIAVGSKSELNLSSALRNAYKKCMEEGDWDGMARVMESIRDQVELDIKDTFDRFVETA